MYKSKSLITSIQFKVGPIVFWIVFISIVVGLGYYVYVLYNKSQTVVNNLTRYSEYIYDYALNSQSITDSVSKIKMDEYDFNGGALTTSAIDSSGNAIPNYKWNTHSEAFLDVIRVLQDIAVLSANPKSAIYKSKVLWDQILKDFVDRVMKNLPTPPIANTVPWGTNWYQFSISFPLFLTILCYVHRRIFGKGNDFFESHLAIYIDNYFTVPNTETGVISMGWLRDGPNAIMMAVPYIGGKLLMKTLDVNDNICKYVRKFSSIPLVTEGEGLFPDMGYIFHTSLRAYGYIYSSIQDFQVIASFFGEDISKLYTIYKRVEHPDIPLHFSPMFTRSASCASAVRGEYGFEVINSIRAAFIKRPDWYLSFYGQKEDLCFYESDKAENTWALIWLGARVFFYKDSPSKWQRELIPYYPGVITYNKVVPILETQTTTTTTFLPTFAKTMLCRLPNAIAMRNEYSVVHQSYSISVVETILVDEYGHHSHYKITPNEDETDPIFIGVNKGKKIEVLTSGVGLGRCYKFDKFNSFIYNSDIIEEGNVLDLFTNVNNDYLQLKPRISNGVANLSFSNTHKEINNIKSVPTEFKIETGTHLLHFDPKVGNYLWLFDKTTDECVITKYYKGYVPSIEIPRTDLSLKFDNLDFLAKMDVYKDKLTAPISINGPQIIVKTKVPFGL